MAHQIPQLSTTEYPRSTPPTLPATAGTIFTDPDFGSQMVRLTVPSDGNTCELTISTSSVWNYDSTKIGPVLTYNYNPSGGAALDRNGWYAYDFNPTTMAVTGRKRLNETGINFNFQYTMWDWTSAATKHKLNGVFNSAADADRLVQSLDTSGTISVAALSTICNFLSNVRISGTVATKSSNTSFTVTWTLPENIDDWPTGMTLTNVTSGTGPVSITAYTASTNTLTVAAGLTVTVGDTLQLNYVGANGLYEVTPDGRYHTWCVSEGNSSRGTGGQDVGRTMFWYDSVGNVLKKKVITTAEVGQVSTLNVGGVHSQQLDKRGRYVIFSYTGISSTLNYFYIWDPLAANPTPANGDGTITVYIHGEHRDIGYTSFVQGDWSSGAPDIIRSRTLPDPTTETLAYSGPLKAGQRAWCCSSVYLSYNHDNTRYVYSSTLQNVVTTGWAAGIGANIYKCTTYAGVAGLSAAENPEGRHNGQALTFMGSASGQAATEALIVASGQYAWDSTNLVVYVRGFSDVDLTAHTADATGTVVANAGNTTLTFKTDLPSAVDNFYKGLVIAFGSGFASCTRRVTGYTAATKFITVDAALYIAPSGTESFTIQANSVILWDWRHAANEIMQVWVDDVSNTQKFRRICHIHSFVTESFFDLGIKHSSNKDGTLMAFESAWGGDTRRDVIVVRSGYVRTPGATATRTNATRSGTATRSNKLSII